MYRNADEKADHENTIGVYGQCGRGFQREGVLHENCDFVEYLMSLSGSYEVPCVMEEDIADPQVMGRGELESWPLDVLVGPQKTVDKSKDGLQVRVVFMMTQRQANVSLSERIHDLVRPLSVTAGLDKNQTERPGREISHVPQSWDENWLVVDDIE